MPVDPVAMDEERDMRRLRLAQAVRQAEDPLAVYIEFVEWIVANYGSAVEGSGLAEILKQATVSLKEGGRYSSDLRYLQLWTMRADMADLVTADKIYANLIHAGIGTGFALLYEKCAAVLEKSGRLTDAQKVFRKGMRASALPQESLRKSYADFKARHPAETHPSRKPQPSRKPPPATQPITGPSPAGTQESRYAAMLTPPVPGKRQELFMFDMSLLWSEGVEYSMEEARARRMGLYKKEWAPVPEPKKKQAKTKTNTETTGLPTPVDTPPDQRKSASFNKSPDTIVPVDFNDSNKSSTRTLRTSMSSTASRRRSVRKSLAFDEPTVTINTKEALADVFGMFNTDSPEKTRKLATMRKVDQSLSNSQSGKFPPLKENAENTPGSTFKSFVDENASSFRKERTPGPAVRPYVDENTSQTPSNKFTPFVDSTSPDNQVQTPGNVSSRPILAPRETPAGENAPRSRVFTPFTPGSQSSDNSKSPFEITNSAKKEPLRDVFTDDLGKPSTKVFVGQHDRAKSELVGQRPVFTPFVDPEKSGEQEREKTPFRVFSRPGEENGDAVTPGTRGVLTSRSAFTPYRDEEEEEEEQLEAEPEQLGGIEEEAEEEEGYEDDFPYDEESGQKEFVVPQEDEDDVAQYVDEQDPDQDQEYDDQDPEGYIDYPEDPNEQAPLRRFGQFTVMTPITERTFEFTTSTSAGASTRALSEELEDVPEEKEDEDELYLQMKGRQPQPPPAPASQGVDVLTQSTSAMTLADSLTRRMNFRPSNPCNPFGREIMQSVLGLVGSDEHFLDLGMEESGWSERLAKNARKSASGRNSRGSAGSARGSWGGGMDPVRMDLPVLGANHEGKGTEGKQRFSATEKIGEGAFGAVYKARDLGVRDNASAEDEEDDDEDIDDDDLDDMEEEASFVAIKVVKPRSLWEYHVLRRVHTRLPSSLRPSIVLPYSLYAFRDESVLVMQLCTQGTLLDIVNRAQSAGVGEKGGCLDELLVMFFAIELFKIVEGLHRAEFIHGDLKIDNCLLRLLDVPGGSSAWDPKYKASGEGGWEHKGLRLIDFGRTIDTRLFPQDQAFCVPQGEWNVDEKDCFELREGRRWTYEPDYFGLASIVYCMLIGKYLPSSAVTMMEGGRRKMSAPMKRYWQAGIWERVFDLCLNPGLVRQDRSMPVTEEMGELRREMEEWLEANCMRASGTLKGLVRRVEMAVV